MHFTSDVIAGIDGSEASAQAAAWALSELARGRVEDGVALVLVAAVPERASHTVTVEAAEDKGTFTSGQSSARAADTSNAQEHAIAQARDQLREVRERLAAMDSGIEIREHIVAGDPAEQLALLSEDDALLVIGHQGIDQQTGSAHPGASGRVGTTSVGLPGHALCPVAIQRGDGEFDALDTHPTTGRGVVVGLDTSDYAGIAALDAASYAQDSGEQVTVIVGVDALGDTEAVRSQTDLDLAWLRSEFPGLQISAKFVSGEPAQVLADAGAQADLLVVGKRGLGRFAGMAVQLGNTSAEVLKRAQGTVLLVPFRDDERLSRRRLVD